MWIRDGWEYRYFIFEKQKWNYLNIPTLNKIIHIYTFSFRSRKSYGLSILLRLSNAADAKPDDVSRIESSDEMHIFRIVRNFDMVKSNVSRFVRKMCIRYLSVGGIRSDKRIHVCNAMCMHFSTHPPQPLCVQHSIREYRIYLNSHIIFHNFVKVVHRENGDRQSGHTILYTMSYIESN